MQYNDEMLDEMSEPVVKFRSNFSKKIGPQINERAGLVDKKEKKYRTGSEHFGKGRTLRDKRKYDVKRMFNKLSELDS
jgi:hypothetical protein